ncbi:Hsp70 family protein [Solwaraspora sp. WMMA2065]|uniref:Hsp70 family protein n=1 Tax=Solwaraspora sp. WMMA2065 TaxID=3015166 RepID=UPI00259AF5B3|nr:Hsp70 family protein [Solwaraspora sp. WMMA2065]WJK33164.1 Hsp70 family protein [Solwaraspora sp. WMMA2065]
MAEDGSLVTGREAWRVASAFPDRLVGVPAAGGGPVTAGETTVESVEVMAALLRRVSDAAGRVVGGSVGEVCLVVPAGWGPRRRLWMRQAAHRAGLGQPSLVEAPVAVAQRVVSGGTQVPVGAFVVVCDVGAGAEVSVLRRGSAGFEVLATLADPDAGGDALDGGLVDALLGSVDGGVSDGAGGGWSVRVGVRAAKESLSWLPAVTVPLPSGGGVVLDGVLLERVAGPVAERVGRLTAEAVAAADLLPGDVAGVFCAGGTSLVPVVPRAVGEAVSVPAVVVEDPVTAAVRGAAGVAGSGASPVVEVPKVPSVRRVVGMAVPGFVSLGLVTQCLSTVDWAGPLFSGSVLVNWGELALAAVLVVVAGLNAGTVFGALAAARGPVGGRVGSVGGQVGTGILAGLSLGVAVAGLYAIVGSLYLEVGVGPFLRWTLLPVTPVAVCAVAAAVVAARGWRTPVGGWADFLAFPNGAAVTAGAGMWLVQYSMSAGRSPGMAVWIDLAGRVGGGLLGAAVVVAVVGPVVLRLVLVAPVAVIGAAIVSWRATGILGAVFAVAVAVWWLRRLWTRIVRAAPAVAAG